jgi:hypothetical protein
MSNALLRTTTAVSWESLGFAGDVRGHIATWFGLHPLTSKTVYVTYDRFDGATTSRPRCPELEAVVRFATLVHDEGTRLRVSQRPDDILLVECELRLRRLVGANPADEMAVVGLAANLVEQKRRRLLGQIAAMQRTGGDVRRQCAEDLFGDGC